MKGARERSRAMEMQYSTRIRRKEFVKESSTFQHYRWHQRARLRPTVALARMPTVQRSREVADVAEPTRAVFEDLARRWQEESLTAPTLEGIVLNTAYQQIIGLGPPALPLIMERLQEGVGHWLWALIAIARQDVGAGNETLEGARQAWLKWGRDQGLVADADSSRTP